MYFLSEASRGAKNQRPCKRKALRTHIPAQSFRRSSRELAHSARIVCLSARICRTDLAPKAETAETIEYFNIRRKEADDPLGKDVKHLLYSIEYSRIRSCWGPLIFEKNIENIVERLRHARRM